MPPGEVHIWTAAVDRLVHRQSTFRQTLSPDEQARADRFVSDEVRTRFVVARGILRDILSRYLVQPPVDLQFVYGRRGKPMLPGTDLRFNLSHSENVVLLGITWGCEIGVDVERIHPIPQMETMARDHFSSYERQMLFSLPSDQRETAFFACWTRKEAYIKAVGDGFALPLTGFDVTLDASPRLLRADGDDPARWSLYAIEPMPSYIGAVCLEGYGWQIIEKQF